MKTGLFLAETLTFTIFLSPSKFCSFLYRRYNRKSGNDFFGYNKFRHSYTRDDTRCKMVNTISRVHVSCKTLKPTQSCSNLQIYWMNSAWFFFQKTQDINLFCVRLRMSSLVKVGDKVQMMHCRTINSAFMCFWVYVRCFHITQSWNLQVYKF